MKRNGRVRARFDGSYTDGDGASTGWVIECQEDCALAGEGVCAGLNVPGIDSDEWRVVAWGCSRCPELGDSLQSELEACRLLVYKLMYIFLHVVPR